jgi:adiponectin receptor
MVDESPVPSAIVAKPVQEARDVADAPQRKRRRLFSPRQQQQHQQRKEELLPRESTPEYLRDDNVFVLGMYRREFEPSLSNCVRSLFSWHNETANVWSHLLGAVLVALLWAVATDRDTRTSPMPLHVFSGTAVLVLAVSAVVHLLYSASRRMYARAWKADYAAIYIVLAGAFAGICPYVFCSMAPSVWTAYVSVAALLAAIGICAAACDAFQGARLRTWRFMSFAVVPLFGLVPIVHTAVALGHIGAIRTVLALTCATLVVTALGGVILYSKVPERWSPGSFDRLGGSHNLWHLAMLAALLVFRQAILVARRYAGDACRDA